MCYIFLIYLIRIFYKIKASFFNSLFFIYNYLDNKFLVLIIYNIAPCLNGLVSHNVTPVNGVSWGRTGPSENEVLIRCVDCYLTTVNTWAYKGTLVHLGKLTINIANEGGLGVRD